MVFENKTHFVNSCFTGRHTKEINLKFFAENSYELLAVNYLRKRHHCIEALFEALYSDLDKFQAHVFRSSHWMFSVKVVPENFANLTEKHLWWSLFLIKLQALSPARLFKKNFNGGVFPVKFAKPLRTSILTNLCERLLLCVSFL